MKIDFKHKFSSVKFVVFATAVGCMLARKAAELNAVILYKRHWLAVSTFILGRRLLVTLFSSGW